MIIAIDGTVASGKGTLAKRLAKHFRLPHMDTGLLYRAVAASAMREGVDTRDEDACAQLASRLDLGAFSEDELRGAGVGAQASVVASLGKVRQVLFEVQRRFALQPGGAVLDGRDIQTAIAPDADVKLWVDADVQERARRRRKELVERGEDVPLEAVIAQLKERDERDATRKDAPSYPAPDAVFIDTTDMSPDETFALAVKAVEAKRR
jgi:cytidylate kinase